MNSATRAENAGQQGDMPRARRSTLREIPLWLSVIARLGFAAKGTIYVFLGVLALSLAIGFTANAEDMRGTIETISRQAFGSIILLLLAFGLVNYGVWNAVQCGWDPERVGTDFVGKVLRVLFGFGAGLNFFLAYKTACVAMGHGWGGETGDEAVKSWTERVLGWPGGRALVLIGAAIVAAVAVSQIVRLVRGKFMDVFSDSELKRTESLVVKTTARLGFVSQAIVAGLIAWFLWRAGLTEEAGEAGGFTKALATLLNQPFGRWLLAFTAVGVMARGLFIWLMVPYREIQMKKSPQGLPARWRRTFGF